MVRDNFGPPVPYEATAVRPTWTDLPVEVRRDGVEAHLGAPVIDARSMGGGFTRAFAAIVTTANGDTAFVKAVNAVDCPHIAACFAREADINAVLPAGVPAPRLRWHQVVEKWTVLGFEAISGRMPSLPWRPDELALTLDVWADTAAVLSPAPAGMRRVGLRPIADELGYDFASWRRMAAGELAVPTLPPYAAGRLEWLAYLEAGWAQACAGDTAIHCDLRVDNVLLGQTDTGPKAWICDWNGPCLAAPWFDTATLLITAYASGLDVDTLFAAHPTGRGVEPEQLDAVLAAFAGYFLSHGMNEEIDSASPYLRAHQWWTGQVTLAWLAERRGWR